ncbi:MAG: universal stress protein E [Lysobacteraceae bacterium]|nr:MAG: universal stress protein E [Xanthomonadaceae bacterium]
MRTIRAILDPDNPNSTVLQRAVLIAQQQPAKLELFCVVHEPAHAFDLFHLPDPEAHRDVVEATRSKLEALAKQTAISDLSVEVVWGYPFDATLLQSIKDNPPDLVVMGLRRAHHPSRKEWHVVRDCRPDLLLVKDSMWTEPPQVMVCLDPSHRHAKPSGLDHCIFASGTQLATAVKGAVKIFHALGMHPMSTDRTQREAEGRAQIAEIVGEQEPEDVWMAHAESPEAIIEYAHAREQSICAMGSLSRTPINEYLLGGALRAVVPAINCDLLLVHPPRNSN